VSIVQWLRASFEWDILRLCFTEADEYPLSFIPSDLCETDDLKRQLHCETLYSRRRNRLALITPSNVNLIIERFLLRLKAHWHEFFEARNLSVPESEPQWVPLDEQPRPHLEIPFRLSSDISIRSVALLETLSSQHRKYTEHQYAVLRDHPSFRDLPFKKFLLSVFPPDLLCNSPRDALATYIRFLHFGLTFIAEASMRTPHPIITTTASAAAPRRCKAQ
jgi:hypothetical protein